MSENSLKIADSTYDIHNINITVNKMESRFSKEVEYTIVAWKPHA